MKRARFSEEQIIGVLKEHELGAKTAEICREHGISEANFYDWKSRYGGLETSEAKRLTEVGALLAMAAAYSPPALSPRKVHRGRRFNSVWQSTSGVAVAYYRTSSAANVGPDKDSQRRRRRTATGRCQGRNPARVELLAQAKRLDRAALRCAGTSDCGRGRVPGSNGRMRTLPVIST